MGIKKQIFLHAAGWILLFPIAAILRGQETPFDPSFRGEASRIKESVVCFTDRSLYVSGERIRFRCEIGLSGINGTEGWSSLVYVELVSADGSREAFAKYQVAGKVAAGEFPIPEHVASGNYFLSCYTRWMRNFGPDTYGYTPIRIIHPFNSGVVQGDDGELMERSVADIAVSDGRCQMKTHSMSYGTGDSISLELFDNGERVPGRTGGCLTVVPLAAKPFLPLQITMEKEPVEDKFRVDFLPDRKGMTLSGSTGPGSTVHITLFGALSDYLVAHSGPTGRFQVSLPMMEETIELFIQCRGPGGIPREVRIDRDFDPRWIALPSDQFELSERELQVALKMARNFQIRDMISSSGALQEDSEYRAGPFYGTGSISVDLEQYVRLPSLKEVFANLVPDVYPVSRKGQFELVIRGENPLLDHYDPLLMVDQVPCFDPEQLMAISPDRIRRIDVVNDLYVKGDQVYGGIINLRSMNGDMAGMALPPHSFFVDMEGVHPGTGNREGDLSGFEEMPDIRNTVHWFPHFGPGGRTSFSAPGHPGSYVALFRCLGPDGKMVVAETVFQVR